VELRCTLDPDSRGGGKKGLGTIHWVHAARSLPASVGLYDRLFTVEQPDATGDFVQVLNPGSLSVASRARVEPSLRDAAPGTHWQFLRVGYFFVDPVESRAGAPVFNRTMTLKDTWASRAAQAETRRESRPAQPKGAPAPGAPGRRGRVEVRAEARAADPALAEAHRRLAALPGVGIDLADLLATDLATVSWYDAAVAAGAPPGPAARWLTNELAGLAGDRPLSSLPLSPAPFGAFVALAESGRVTKAGAKSLLASLLDRPGDPATRLSELGLERVDDEDAVAAGVGRALARNAAEVARYRAGETKLLGFLLGAAMKETRGRSDPGTVKKLLLQQLG
jgi:glutaminyl-tRNA synthetase